MTDTKQETMVFTERRKLGFRTKACYGVGHVLNDLCSSMWFTYLLVYLHQIAKFSNIKAGALLLVGQIADGICTPLVGIESDNTGNFKYGRRKVWHAVGVACVAFTFPFVFNLCISNCKNADDGPLFFYYALFIIIFQFGWATTQISHLALIPELSDDEHEKCGLNVIRYAATVSCSIFVYVITWVMLATEGSHSQNLSQADAPAFMKVAFIVVGTGLFFMIIFHLGVKEPSRDSTYEFATKGSKRSPSNWTKWFREVQFYQVAVLYMCTRLIVNITQVYIPMFTMDTLGLTKDAIAIVPLIIYVSGFFSTFLSKPLNKWLGRKVAFVIGLLVTLGSCLWMWLLPMRNSQVYGATAVLGFGGSTLLVTSLTMTADLIGDNVETGAFVYGAMSFVDKFSNGIAVQLVQVFYPCTNEIHCAGSQLYYRCVMVFIPGGAAVLALLVLFSLFRTKIGVLVDPAASASLDTTSIADNIFVLISTSGSFTNVYLRSSGACGGPHTVYEPLTSQLGYGACAMPSRLSCNMNTVEEIDCDE